jgi:hypothetical protein
MSRRGVFLIVTGLVALIACPAAMAQGVSLPGSSFASGATTSSSIPPTPPASSGIAAPAELLPTMPLPMGGAYLAPPRPRYENLPSAADAPAPTMACCADGKPDHFTPYMLGDFVGPVANQFSDVKIAEGESPRPLDRVFYKFNYYNNLNKPRWADPTEPIHNVDLFRHVFGFEKTFFDQRVSVGLRIPFYTLDAEAKEFRVVPDPSTGALVALPGGPGLDTTQFGNVSAIAKGVLWEDHQTGSLISAGATLSFPTSSSRLINPGQSTVAYLQPFAGFIFNSGDLFVQGFTSITLPVVHAESIVLFNDLGVGYYVYRATPRAGGLTAVAPTVELHIADPLRSPDPGVDLFGIVDDEKLHNVVDVTLGTTLEFGNRATVGAGLVFPLTGPKPFDMEALVQLNYRF